MVVDAHQTSILVAIGNRVLCESLCHFLKSRQPMDIYSINNIQKIYTPPDLVLFDSSKLLETLQPRYPNAKFILIDTGLKEQEITYLLNFNKIAGVIPPDANIELFIKALNVVHSGQLWIGDKHLKSLLDHNGSMTANGNIKSLSYQDMEIVKFIVQGLKNKEIAEHLCLSEHTIKAHISRILKKLNISRRIQLASLFLENGQNR